MDAGQSRSWLDRISSDEREKEKNAQDHENWIVSMSYCPAEEEDMDSSNSPGNWPAPFLIVFFVWNVGRKSGEFSPKSG